MKYIRHLLLFAFLLIATRSAGIAQSGAFTQCLANIQARIEGLGEAGKKDFNQYLLHDDIKDYDIGKVANLLDDEELKEAFELIYKSMSEFADLAGANLSAKGMRGYGRFCPCIIERGSDTVAHLKEAFMKAGVFNGKAFDDIMRVLGDESRVAFDAANRKIILKRVNLEIPQVPFDQGEKHALTHILRGHLDNGFSPGKSKFLDTSEFFDILEEGWRRCRNETPVRFVDPNGSVSWGYRVDMSRVIGTKKQQMLLIAVEDVNGAPGNRLLSAYPIKK